MMKTKAYSYKATIKINKKTKLLCQIIKPGEIALISHKDLDEIAAKELILKNVRAIINCQPFISGSYPHKGPELLLKKGVVLLEHTGDAILSQLKDGDLIQISNNYILKDNKLVAKGELLTLSIFNMRYSKSESNLEQRLREFVNNTLTYARKETGMIIGPLHMPATITKIKDKHVVVVVRGKSYREDFETIMPFINETSPVLIGVDGGADLIVEKGFRPDIIIGDMDSVSNKSLKYAKEIIVHAYPGGNAPGEKRIQSLGLPCKYLPAPGTSEDVALLLAYEKQARLIVAVGTHSHMIDFLEKGRKGMGSTFLVRLKIGSRLVDAKGVSQLYRNKIHWPLVTFLVFSALLPISVLLAMSPVLQDFFKVVWLRLKMALL